MENKLDGNAAAGILQAIFPFEMTMAQITCTGCGTTMAMGATDAYMHGMETVLDFHRARIHAAKQSQPATEFELTAADCAECPKGQLPFCIDNTCVCSDDIPPGRIGPYSDVATAPSTAGGLRPSTIRNLPSGLNFVTVFVPSSTVQMLSCASILTW